MQKSGEEAGLALMEQNSFMPALSIQQAVERFDRVVEFVRTVMREGVDYGRIPGTDKATLLKPGAEKLCTLFGLTSRFDSIRSIEDWDGSQHGGEPFFYFLYRCQLWRNDRIIAEGDGSCNSFEQKYRYREAQRRCPGCGQATIIKGKEEYGGGWLCFRKRGGCGAKFINDDTEITSQVSGRIVNENIADQVNTMQKMAQKRALIAATLLAVNGSEFFTQDVEDRIINIEPAEVSGVVASRRVDVADGPVPSGPPPSATDEDDYLPNGPMRESEAGKKGLLNGCAEACRSLKALGHPNFQDKKSIIKHLQVTARAREWRTGVDVVKLESFSDLSLHLLSEYLTILQSEIKAYKGDRH